MSQPLIFDLEVDNKQAVDSINAFFDIYEKGVQGLSKIMADALGKPVEKKIQIKLEGGKLVAKEIEEIDDTTKNIQAAQKALNKEYGKTPAALDRQLKVIRAIRRDTEKYDEKTKKVSESWRLLTETIREIKVQIKDFNKVANEGGNSLQQKLITSQIAADALMGAFRMLTGSISGFVSTGADMEVLFIQLQGFTGGVQEAADAYKRFVEIGAATPFTAKQVGQAARTMMGFGIETSKAIDQVERLAIVASATGGQLNEMARNMGQIQANQKAYTRDLMQFANQGIPIYSEIAKLLDVTTGEVRKMAEEGEIGFTEVSAALRELTKEGSNLANIADKMDKTISGRMEAMRSAVESFAGSFVLMINSFDQATGGLIGGSVGLLTGIINGIADAMQSMTANMQVAAPVIAALAVGMGALVALTIKQNWIAIVNVFSAWANSTRVLTIATNAQIVAQAFLNALTGQWVTIAAAAAIAAGVAAGLAYANRDAVDEEAAAIERSKIATEGSIEEKEKLAFSTDKVTGSLKKFIETQKEEYDRIKEGMDIHKKRAQMAIQYQKDRLKSLKENQKQARNEIKDSVKVEIEMHKRLKARHKQDHKERMSRINERYDRIQDTIDLELDELDKKSAAEKALEAIERRRLVNKLASLKYGTEEFFETKVRLEQMDKAVRREELLARKKENTRKKTAEIKEEEARNDKVEKAEKRRHDAVMGHFKQQEEALDKTLKAEEQKVEEMQSKYDSFFRSLSAARFKDHQQAMGYLQEQIDKYSELARERESTLNETIRRRETAATADSETVADRRRAVGRILTERRASGGPVQGGSAYTVNELGKEAFLSASGRLSMINAPAWGTWKAPSSGTVIPAHLTQQLNIPASGININRPAGISRGGGGSVRHGDVVSNQVTIQAANPVQAANHMMLQLTKLKRLRH